MAFTKLFRNKFIEIIENSGLDSKLFKSEFNKSNYFRIQFDENFFFEIDDSDEQGYAVVYTIFKINGIEESDKMRYSLQGVFDEFDYWVKEEIKVYMEELNTPDLWEQINKSSKENYFKSDDSEFQPFSTDEQQQVRMALNEFKNRTIKEFNPTENEVKLITERLDYLADKVDKINRFDWKGLALSTLISISITLSLDTEQGQKLFDWFRELIMIIPQITS